MKKETVFLANKLYDVVKFVKENPCSLDEMFSQEAIEGSYCGRYTFKLDGIASPDVKNIAQMKVIVDTVAALVAPYVSSNPTPIIPHTNINSDSVIELIKSHYPEIENEEEAKLATAMLLKTQATINNISYSFNSMYPNSIKNNEEFFMCVQNLMNRIATVQTNESNVFQNFTELQAKAASMETQIATLREELAEANERNTKLNSTIQMLTMAVAAQQDQK